MKGFSVVLTASLPVFLLTVKSARKCRAIMVATKIPFRNRVEKLPNSPFQLQKCAILSRIMASGFLENFNARAQIVWAALWSHSGSCSPGESGDYFTERCWPSEAQLAGELGCNPRTVRRAIRQLVSGGALRRDRRGRRLHWHAGSVLVIPKTAILTNAPDRTKLSYRSTGQSCPVEITNTKEIKPTNPVVVSHSIQEPTQPAQSPPARPKPSQPKQPAEWRDATTAELDTVAALPIGRDGMRSRRAVATIRAGGVLDHMEAAWLHGVIRSERPVIRSIEAKLPAATIVQRLQRFGMRSDYAQMLAVSMPVQALHWLEYARRHGKRAGFIVKACQDRYAITAA